MHSEQILEKLFYFCEIVQNLHAVIYIIIIYIMRSKQILEKLFHFHETVPNLYTVIIL